MKKAIILAAVILFSTVCMAQRAPKWACEKGYWVVQTNINQPKNNIVCFYNNEHVLLYKEKVDGVVIRMDKRRVKMQLKKVLDQSLLAYEAKHKAMENERLVAALMTRR